MRECEGNVLEACVINKYDFYSKALPFTICFEENSSNWQESGKKCAPKYGIDWDAVTKCANSQEGADYILKLAEKTEALQPAHTYVPWVVVNNQHSQSTESAVIRDMVKYVCSIYTGPEKIAACK